MSVENAKAFLEKAKSDAELRDRLSGAESVKERAEIAQAEGFDFTKEEIQSAAGALSDDELQSVSGGSAGWLWGKGKVGMEW